MAKQRYINTKFWSDSFIVDLNPLDRYLFLYLLTNEHTNIAGIYELPITRLAQETGIDKEMIPKMLRRLSGKVRHIQGWVIIKNFQKHQQAGEKITSGIDKIMAELPLKIKEYYTNWQAGKDRVSIGYDRVSIDPELSKSNLNSNSNTNSNNTCSASAAGNEINLLIEKFKPINPSYERLYPNKTQRSALERMVKKWGAEKVGAMIDQLPQIINQKYAPKPTTPIQLEEKLGAIKAFLDQYKEKNKSKLIKL